MIFARFALAVGASLLTIACTSPAGRYDAVRPVTFEAHRQDALRALQ